jgi:hypothetical protein
MSFAVCSYCAEELEEMSQSAYKTYLEVCQNYTRDVVSKIDESVPNELKSIVWFLEKFRYVFTVDMPGLISVYPRKRLRISASNGESFFFCNCGKIK